MNYAVPDLTRGVCGNIDFAGKTLKSLDMIYMIMGYKNPHNTLDGNIHILQKPADGGSRNSGIYKYSMRFVPQVITITAAPAAKTAKNQLHLPLVHQLQRYYKII
jgi:hypothetical protein